MVKHAYLIIVHNEPELLQKLIDLIDDSRNDIYIHIDKKIDATQFRNLKTLSSRIVFIKSKKVYWGHYSQVDTELRIMEAAVKNGPYSYYHLLSGVDLPLYDQDYIHDFFVKNKGAEFVHLVDDSADHQADIKYKNERWFFFMPFVKSKSFVLKKLFYLSQSIQTRLGVKRRQKQKIYKGSNWFSITENLVKHILKHKKEIKKLFRWSCCCDEFVVQTYAMNSEYAKRISDKGNMREIDWQRGNPYVWRDEDLQYLADSQNLFARKFSSTVDSVIIDKIYRMVKTRKAEFKKVHK